MFISYSDKLSWCHKAFIYILSYMYTVMVGFQGESYSAVYLHITILYICHHKDIFIF